MKKHKKNGLIVKPDHLPQETVIKMVQEKYNLKQDRQVLIDQARDIRAKVYALSAKINKLEGSIDAYVLDKFSTGET